MKGLTPRNDKEREFMKTFDDLCYGQSRYKVWDDFVHMAALSIVNTVDKTHFQERKERFQRIRKPYGEKEFMGFCSLLSTTTLALEENPFQDFLGELYMRCDLGNDHAGQFFTPYHICEMMAKIIVSGDEDLIRQEVKKRGYVSLCDPCIGGGAMMIGGAQALYDLGINYQQDAVFIGQDIDPTVAMMAYIQLSLLGCPGYVVIGNSLTEPMTGHVLFGGGTERTYYTPMWFSEKMHFLRHMALVRKMFALTGITAETQTEPAPSKPETDQEAPKIENLNEQTKSPNEPHVIEISKKKGKAMAGQMMFSFE